MKRFRTRLAAWLMLLALLLSSSVGTVAQAAETTAAKNPLEVTAEELAGGKVLYVTPDMVAQGKQALQQSNMYRANYQAIQAILKNGEIVDQRYKFY